MNEQRTVFQKAVLVILAVMIVLFGIVTAVNQSREGILFEEAFLRKEEATDAECFAGRVHGERVTILRWYGSENGTRTITLRVGERFTDTYTVYLGEPMIPLAGVVSSAASRLLEVPTVRIAKNGTVIFEGGYQESTGGFYTSEGEWSGVNLGIKIYSSGVDLWENYTVPEGTLVQLALEPELVDRGDWRLYGLMVFLTLIAMVDVAFPYTIFRWRYHWWVKDPEPTDDYIIMQHLAWIIILPVLLGGYIWAATTTITVV